MAGSLPGGASSCCGASENQDRLSRTCYPAERAIDERAQVVDELGGTHEADSRHRLTERHVLEQAAERDRAVARVIDDVELLVVGGEVADLARGVEVDVVLRGVAEAFLGE